MLLRKISKQNNAEAMMLENVLERYNITERNIIIKRRN
ncbi:hypothetical protein GGR35_000326 [Mucilaginibacter phyllosphaerae]|uniref:Uncharacterized protein n=1 Tax=Mucilaginibacter phyllosphaerae TaxID=1812349 RepID=A0ABR6I413_9SPHI|nr:hypothetical protein [Mucilaginibacter phyllosphaerae]